jgi:hypothetical protein
MTKNKYRNSITCESVALSICFPHLNHLGHLLLSLLWATTMRFKKSIRRCAGRCCTLQLLPEVCNAFSQTGTDLLWKVCVLVVKFFSRRRRRGPFYRYFQHERRDVMIDG